MKSAIIHPPENLKRAVGKDRKYIPDFRITTSNEYRYKDNGMLDSLITNGLEWSGKCLSLTIPT